jgi:hypothetical protein
VVESFGFSRLWYSMHIRRIIQRNVALRHVCIYDKALKEHIGPASYTISK